MPNQQRSHPKRNYSLGIFPWLNYPGLIHGNLPLWHIRWPYGTDFTPTLRLPAQSSNHKQYFTWWQLLIFINTPQNTSPPPPQHFEEVFTTTIPMTHENTSYHACHRLLCQPAKNVHWELRISYDTSHLQLSTPSFCRSWETRHPAWFFLTTNSGGQRKGKNIWGLMASFPYSVRLSGMQSPVFNK